MGGVDQTRLLVFIGTFAGPMMFVPCKPRRASEPASDTRGRFDELP
jgi:hypothetical protein